MSVSLRTILIASFVVMTTLTVSLTGYLSFRNGRLAVSEAVTQLRTEIARQIQSRLRAQLEIPGLINRINAAAISQGLLADNDPLAMEKFFWRQIQSQASVSSIFFGNNQGGLADAGREGADGSVYVIATDDFAAGPFRKYATDDKGNRTELILTVADFDARERPWYRLARDTRTASWSDIYVLFTGQDMAIAASRPVYDEQGELLGVAASDIFLSQLSDYLQGLSIVRSGQAFIVEPSGMLVATSTAEPLFHGAEGGSWRRLSASQSGNPVTRAALSHAIDATGGLAGLTKAVPFTFNHEGRRYFAQVTPFDDEPGLDWYTTVVVPESDYMEQINANSRWTVILILAMLFLAIIVGVAGSRWISDPLARLSRAARALSRGEESFVTTGRRIREIDELSTTFNTMAVHIHELLEGMRAEVVERENAEKELRRSESRYRSVVNNIREIVFQIDESGQWMFLNPSWTTLTGFTIEEALGESFLNYVHPDDRQPDQDRFMRLVRREQTQYRGETRMLHKDGSTRWMEVYARLAVDDAGEVKGTSGTLTDVTERMQADMALRRMQKMDAIGRLSGGIAHDFNNLLAIILGNLDLLERHNELDDKTRKWLASIRKSTQRAENLTRRLLGFSRRQASQSRICDVNRIILDMEHLLARSITPQIDLELHLADDLRTTNIDPGDFEDALLNLVINARDAMPNGGNLTIETRNLTLDAAFCILNPAVTPGDYVEISVVDTGLGVAAEHLERIFEPFFTTKSRDKGTGLGLAMVYGFVQRSGGYAKIDSEPGQGAHVRIYLPRVEGEKTEIPALDNEDGDPTPRGQECILVVEDEPELCELARAVLVDLGYTVVTAANGIEALARLAEHPDIDLLFTDVVMPGGMSGYDLAEAVAASRPGLKILLTSGYTERIERADGRSRFHAHLLRKPYSPNELAQRISMLLGESGHHDA